DVAVAQAAKETAFGRYTGVVPPDFHNWAGLKTTAGGGDSDPSAHARFPDDSTGVRAHLQHLSAYAGLQLPPGDVIVDPRYALVRRGSARTVEELGGKWAPSPDYGRSIVRDYLLPMIATVAADRTPAFPDVPPGHWAEEAIRQVTGRGIMRGYEDGTFRPDRPVTRAELAAVVAHILNSLPKN
ncbi:MAG: S-layer homology domain-containing protein, partial [Hydrogenibacillus schlegelii]|nr:S-layer homology domain-containing protein [Hydrogenibacillus schlegelii]